jgi:hypothetical protein
MSGVSTRLLSAAVAVGLAGSAPATTYYVNRDCGNDGWAGTSPVCAAPDGPKHSIGAALDLTITGDEVVVADGVYIGAANRNLDLLGRDVTVRSANGPQNCIIDCQGDGRAFALQSGETVAAVIRGFTIRNGSATDGGGVYLFQSDATVIDCIFQWCSADRGAGLYQTYIGSDETGALVVEGCTFVGGTAEVGGGGLLSFSSSLAMSGCVFLENDGGLGPGGMGCNGPEARIVDCLAAGNTVEGLLGGMGIASDEFEVVNCVVVRNAAPAYGGLDLSGTGNVINCTSSLNNPGGLSASGPAPVAIYNCIAWGNEPFDADIAPENLVSHCDIGGGWPGPGNIDAEPLFLQPAQDDFRLVEGSPCADAGDSDAVPPDITTDIDGNPRIIGGAVDMGAYEGESEAQAPADSDGDVDHGETVFLVPTGGPFNPRESAAVMVTNHSGPDDATFTVTEYDQALHPDAGGYSELGCILSLETSLEDGQYRATLFIPVNLDGLDPVNYLHVNVTRYDPLSGNWSLAVTGNTVNSPGFDGPIGNRVTALTGGPWGVTQEPGDYGIFVDPGLEQAFAWANVDRAQDFGIGVALCPADCRQTPDGAVNVVDFLAMLARWGDAAGGGPCDIDYDAVIDMDDFAALLDAWGPCGRAALPAAPPPAGSGGIRRSADLDRDGSVGVGDVRILRALLGPCTPDCKADLNADGRVDPRDYLAVLARWDRSSPRRSIAAERGGDVHPPVNAGSSLHDGRGTPGRGRDDVPRQRAVRR